MHGSKCASLISATGQNDILDKLLAGVRAKLSFLGVLVLPEVLIPSAKANMRTIGSLVGEDIGAWPCVECSTQSGFP
ncbi:MULTISPECIES: hypothetical protein [Sphingomonadaceae]|jgi:hypothetical protein|uniref:Uncharacterized protein n=1 Tax=Sphingomonas echinoides TaxID=59803 RepID=A0ABU4PWL2_9SPHN|nr:MULTISPECIES: hypothetical protein [Sphingomonadaceae]MDX5986400.1 hypothetical protein [Sphingomonas echinoides]QXF14333.1 hypothetical protein HBA51_18915 [Sphingopyxis terrae subsp. terrae]